MHEERDAGASRPTRRTVVKGLAATGALAIAGVEAIQAASVAAASRGLVELRGTSFDLRVGETPVNITGRGRTAYTINGNLPAPTLRWRQGDEVTIDVHNTFADRDTSLHWHGILLPANMDGVPGLSFHGIHPGTRFTYKFRVKQHGTYWYHSHSAFDEQLGLYGALVIDPAEPPPVQYDREHVVLLSDWSDERPERILSNLKKQSDYYNFQKRTVGDFFGDVRRLGLARALGDRRMWNEMRMNPTDLGDVTGATYTYLMNGLTPSGNWTGVFTPGERVRLRLINGSAQSYFDVRIPGLKLTVIAADGQDVRPVEVDELRIATAETFDVIVSPSGRDAFTIFAQAADRTGYAAGTLAVREGLRGEAPAMDRRQLLTMADMGHGDVAAAHDHAAMAPTAAAGDPHAGHTMPSGGGVQTHPDSERGNPLVDMQATDPKPRLNDPGVGLRDNGRRVLTYADLRNTFADPDGREPLRTIELHLTGHMEKFSWSFDGITFADAEPIRLKYGERVRFVLVNDTMMAHPIHLHGMWSDLEDEQGQFLVRKHTIDMQPGTKRSFRVRADALGRWAFHCHLLYHMESGMFREVRVEE